MSVQEHFTKVFSKEAIYNNNYIKICSCVPHILQSYCQLILFWWPEKLNNEVRIKHWCVNTVTTQTFFLFMFFLVFLSKTSSRKARDVNSELAIQRVVKTLLKNVVSTTFKCQSFWEAQISIIWRIKMHLMHKTHQKLIVETTVYINH